MHDDLQDILSRLTDKSPSVKTLDIFDRILKIEEKQHSLTDDLNRYLKNIIAFLIVIIILLIVLIGSL